MRSPGKNGGASSLTAPISRSSAYADGVIYTGSEDGNLYALDATNGRELWRFATGGDLVGTPAVADGLVFVALPTGDGLFVIDAVTGTEVSQLSGLVGGAATPASVDDGSIYVGGKDSNAFYRIDIASGDVLWQLNVGSTMLAAPAVVGGVVYGGLSDGTLLAIDSDTGQLLWSFATDGLIDFGPSVANGVVYASTDTGGVYAIGGIGRGTPEAIPVAEPGSATPDASPIVAIAEPQFIWASNADGTVRGVMDVEVLQDGNVAVANGVQVVVMSPDGEFVTTIGTQGTGDGQFVGPLSLAVDSLGNFYVSDYERGDIQKFDAAGNHLLTFGSKGVEEDQFEVALGIAIDAEDNLYIADDVQSNIKKFDSDGNYLMTFSAPGVLAAPVFPAIDPQGHLWVAEHNNHLVHEFAPDGTYLGAWGTRGGAPGEFTEVSAVAIDAAGNFYIVDSSLNRVQVFDADQTYLYGFGGTGPGDGQFRVIYNIALDDRRKHLRHRHRQPAYTEVPVAGRHPGEAARRRSPHNPRGNTLGSIGAGGVAVFGRRQSFCRSHFSTNGVYPSRTVENIGM